MAADASPEDLLRIYQTGLEEYGAPACETLLKLLSDSADNDVPLSAINLRGAAVGAPGAPALAQVLRADAFLTLVNLEENELGDDGVTAIADALRAHPTIFRLDLGYNAGGPKCLKAVAGLLQESPSLLCLDLSGNNLYSRLSMFGPSSMSALAPIGKALADPACKLQLLHLDQARRGGVTRELSAHPCRRPPPTRVCRLRARGGTHLHRCLPPAELPPLASPPCATSPLACASVAAERCARRPAQADVEPKGLTALVDGLLQNQARGHPPCAACSGVST